MERAKTSYQIIKIPKYNPNNTDNNDEEKKEMFTNIAVRLRNRKQNAQTNTQWKPMK